MGTYYTIADLPAFLLTVAAALQAKTMTTQPPVDPIPQQQPRSKRLRERQQSPVSSAGEDGDDETIVAKRPRAADDDSTNDGELSAQQQRQPTAARWKAHQMAEDYVRLASHMMLHPLNHLGPYGYPVLGEPAAGGDGSRSSKNNNNRIDGVASASTAVAEHRPTKRSYPLQHMSVLAYLKSAVRRPTVVEQWSPYEISLFEAAIAEYGKEFHRIAREIGTRKTTKDVIDFYYIWKKTAHYQRWKKEYTPEYLLEHSDDEE